MYAHRNARTTPLRSTTPIANDVMRSRAALQPVGAGTRGPNPNLPNALTIDKTPPNANMGKSHHVMKSERMRDRSNSMPTLYRARRLTAMPTKALELRGRGGRWRRRLSRRSSSRSLRVRRILGFVPVVRLENSIDGLPMGAGDCAACLASLSLAVAVAVVSCLADALLIGVLVDGRAFAHVGLLVLSGVDAYWSFTTCSRRRDQASLDRGCRCIMQRRHHGSWSAARFSHCLQRVRRTH